MKYRTQTTENYKTFLSKLEEDRSGSSVERPPWLVHGEWSEKGYSSISEETLKKHRHRENRKEDPLMTPPSCPHYALPRTNAML